MSSGPRLRIGELSRRLGLTTDVLRAWEDRYGIPSPERSPGGLRLYGPEEVARLQAMQRHIAGGLSPAEAARAAKGSAADAGPGTSEGVQTVPLACLAAALEEALDRFDDAGAQAVLDQLFAGFSRPLGLREVILPYLGRLGRRWADGEVTVAQEHFASGLIRGRLLALGRGWDRGSGPRAVLACVSGELHDLGLICFALALREHGWRVTYLGQDTPAATLAEAAGRLEPDAVVVSATSAGRLRSAAKELESLAGAYRLFLGGAGASGRGTLPGRSLTMDAVSAADAVAQDARP